MEPLVRRHDGRPPGRPHVQLPADVSQRRRRAGHRRGAGRRRLGGDPRRNSPRAQFWDDVDALGLHAVPVHRRAVPLSAECAAASAGDGAPDQAVLRQRLARRRLERVQDAISYPADPRVLRRDRRQRLALQRRRQARRDRPHSARSWRTAFPPRW